MQVHMSLSLIADICEELPQVRSVKLESTPTPSRTKELISMLDQRLQRSRPTILTGLGGLYGKMTPSFHTMRKTTATMHRSVCSVIFA